jgi:hypothetical protein
MGHEGTNSPGDRRSPADCGFLFEAVLPLGVWRDTSPTDSQAGGGAGAPELEDAAGSQAGLLDDDGGAVAEDFDRATPGFD